MNPLESNLGKLSCLVMFMPTGHCQDPRLINLNLNVKTLNHPVTINNDFGKWRRDDLFPMFNNASNLFKDSIRHCLNADSILIAGSTFSNLVRLSYVDF